MTATARLVAVLLCAVSIAEGQQSDALEQQLRELKQQYVETTRAFEQRIAALEQQIEKGRAPAAPTEGTISATDLAKEVAEKTVSSHSDQVGAKFQGAVPSAPTYDLL